MKNRILISSLGIIIIIAAIASVIIIHGAIITLTTTQQNVNNSSLPSSCADQKANAGNTQTSCQSGQISIQRQGPGTPLPTPTPTPATPTQAPPVTSSTPVTPPNSGGAGGGSTSTENQLAQQLFNQINSDRATQGLPAYAWNATLARGAYQHNVTMTTTGCGLAHQCPNEPDPCQRITNEGITWMACGENIGYTSPYPDTWTAIKQNIEGGMLAEKPPDDGHRKNLLSTSFHQIGVGVLIDSKGTAWVTEDFTN